MAQLFNSAANVTFTAGSPGVVNWAGHTLTAGMAVTFGSQRRWDRTPGTPAPLVPGIVYYVKTATAGVSFTLSATNGGTAINITGTQQGVVSAQRCYKVLSVSGNNVTIEVDATGFSAFTPFSSTAAGAFSVGGTSITLTAPPNANVANGWTIYDTTSNKAIGRVGSVAGSVINIDTGWSNILNSSSGSSDTITFATGLAGYGNYEGGSGCSGTASMQDAIRNVSKDCANWQADIVTTYNALVSAGGEFPSCFQIAGAQNAWSVL